MLILLAVGSANGLVGTTGNKKNLSCKIMNKDKVKIKIVVFSVTILNDMRPHWKRSNIVSGVCLVSCLLGMIYTNRVS